MVMASGFLYRMTMVGYLLFVALLGKNNKYKWNIHIFYMLIQRCAIYFCNYIEKITISGFLIGFISLDVKYNHYKRKSRQKAARVCALSRKGIQNKCQNHHHQENPHISEKPNGDKTDHRIAMAAKGEIVPNASVIPQPKRQGK